MSEYFRGLLRDAQEREKERRLDALLLEGLKSGHDINVDERFWKDLRSEASALVLKHRAKA